jgi:thioredoxin-like negative regulator of GroEL
VIEQLLQADRLLQVDQVRQARDMYQRVVDLDPGNAIAVVGLARCALADGDDAGAHALAVRALGIDPEDDMARRMEARLAEILATRGMEVTRPAQPTAKQESVASPTLAQQPTPATRPAMRKSFLDRLLGR